MKREVDSSVVERGVAERVRLQETYEKRTEELQKQHDSVKSNLSDHKIKVRKYKLFKNLNIQLQFLYCQGSSNY